MKLRYALIATILVVTSSCKKSNNSVNSNSDDKSGLQKQHRGFSNADFEEKFIPGLKTEDVAALLSEATGNDLKVPSYGTTRILLSEEDKGLGDIISVEIVMNSGQLVSTKFGRLSE